MKKKRIAILCGALVLILALLLGGVWAVLTGFGHDPFGLVTKSTLKGITLEEWDLSKRMELTERDCSAYLAFLDHLRLRRYEGEVDPEIKTMGKDYIVTLKLWLLPDVEYTRKTVYTKDSADQAPQWKTLFLINGVYYDYEEGFEDSYFEAKLLLSYIIQDKRPHLNLEMIGGAP